MRLGYLLLSLLLSVIPLAAKATQQHLTITPETAGDINLMPLLYISQTQAERFAQIRHQPDKAWHKLNNHDIKRIGARNLWLKLNISNPGNRNQRILTLANPLLDQITIYHLVNGHLKQKLKMGDSLPFGQRPLLSNLFAYPIQFKAHSEHTFYLAVESTGAIHLDIALQTPQNLTQQTESLTLLHGFQMGALAAIGIFALFIAFTTGSFSYCFYAGYVLTMTLLVASVHGFAFRYLWPNLPDIQQYIIPLLLPLVMAFALLFSEKILQLKRYSHKLLRASRGFTAIAILLSLLSPWLGYEIAIYLDILAVLLISCLLMCIAVRQAVEGHKVAKLYTIGWFSMLLGAFITSLLYLGLIALPIKPQTPVMLGLTFEVIFMAAVLAIRYSDERKSKLAIQQQALEQAERVRKIREESLRVEAQTNAKLERMVQERTLELEITLRELHEANRKLTEQTTVDSLTQVKNRNAFDKRLQAEGRLSRRQQTPMSLLMLDIDKFKAINDSFGHLAGDDILRRIALLLQNQLKRPSDLLSRFGGEEFAIILPHTSAQGAMHLAELIRQAVVDLDIKWEQQDIPLTVSIGVSAAVIESDSHPTELLEQADRALYQAKHEGRNRVCLYSPKQQTVT